MISERTLQAISRLSLPVATVLGYFKTGTVFHRLTGPGLHPSGTLILIHGWNVRSASLALPAEYFLVRGYDVFCYDYASSRASLPQLGHNFLTAFRALVRNTLPGKSIGPIFFLTHSMGGPLLRFALAEMSEEECARIGRIVMLAPPNRGSDWGTFAHAIPGLRLFNRSLGDLRTGPDSPLHTIGLPKRKMSCGIIAGTRDAKVARKYLDLPEGWESSYCEFPYGHGALCRSAKVCSAAEFYFKNGTFPR